MQKASWRGTLVMVSTWGRGGKFLSTSALAKTSAVIQLREGRSGTQARGFLKNLRDGMKESRGRHQSAQISALWSAGG